MLYVMTMLHAFSRSNAASTVRNGVDFWFWGRELGPGFGSWGLIPGPKATLTFPFPETEIYLYIAGPGARGHLLS